MRRKEILNLVKRLQSTSQALVKKCDTDDLVQDMLDIDTDIEGVLADEEYYMDNIPENLQNGSNYANAEYACDKIENAISCVDDAIRNVRSDKSQQAIENIDKAIDYLYDAM